MNTAELLELFQKFGMALAIGLLIGVERERQKAGSFAGIRTFALITLTGCATAMLESMSVNWLFAVGFLAITALSFRAFHTSDTQHGITTQVSAILAYLLGGMVWWGLAPFASAIAVVMVLLLAAKEPLERLASQIGHKDIIAIVQFGIITLIILPIVPDQTYGPLNVLNPHKIWLMVVLISAIDLVGYAVSKIVGTGRGTEIVGAVGGLISSTAVALGLSKKSKTATSSAEPFAIGILLASCIMFPRVLLVAFTQNQEVARHLLFPVLAATCAGMLGCAALWRIQSKRQKDHSAHASDLESRNPLELSLAIKFGLLFGVIMFIAKAAQVYTGEAGVYLSSIVAGLTNVDAITLSLSDFAASPEDTVKAVTIAPVTAARGIVLATASNTMVKAAIVTFAASPEVRKRALPVFLLIGAAAVASALLLG
jgi:uncharacterized membrane protein (DUF4010 family)